MFSFIFQFTYLFIDRFIYYLSDNLCINIFIYLDIYLSKHLFACFYFFLLPIDLTNFNYTLITYTIFFCLSISIFIYIIT